MREIVEAVAKHEAGGRDSNHAADDQVQDVAGARTERHPDADLASALLDPL